MIMRLGRMAVFVNGVEIGQAVEASPPPPKVPEMEGVITIKVRWATPRNDEKWQGSGKRRKPRLKYVNVMNLLEAQITKILSVTEREGYWYVKYQYNVWGKEKLDERRFKYREDAEKLKVGETIIV